MTHKIRSNINFFFSFDGTNIQEFRQRLCDFVEDELSMNPGDTLHIEMDIVQTVKE